MPTRAQFRLDVMVVVLTLAAMTLPRLWAARHSTHSGIDGTIADAIQVAI